VRTWNRRKYIVLGFALALATLVAAVWLPAAPGSRLRSASAPSTMIYDTSGVLLYEILDPYGGSQRTIPLGEIPDTLRQAVIATEDASFYINPGYSPLALLRAASMNIRAGRIVSGGSTITQQVARQLLLGEERYKQTLVRKMEEIWLAIRMTATLSKDDILALYLNETYFGNLSYGVDSAARGYFGKPARELSLAESALLAGIPQSPVAYNPLTHPEAARERQGTVLNLMVKAGYIDQTEADRAARESLDYAGEPYSIRAPHYSMMVRDALGDLVGEETIARGGLAVQTTLDWGLQQRAERAVQAHLAGLNMASSDSPAHRVGNAAVVALDSSGALCALVGSPDYWDDNIDGAVNGATSLRQPGSALKPFTYAAAFEQGMSPASTVADVRTEFRTYESTPYVPANYDLQYHGLVSLREALAGSYNVAAVRVLDTIGVRALPDMARRFGIETLNQPERQGLALTLGGAEVRLYDLTAAYASLAAEGQRVTPYLIQRVTDGEGRVLYDHTPSAGVQAIDERIAYLVTDILADADARGAVFGHGSALDLPFPAAVKTGTTSEWRDNWTVGYSTEWTIGVWVGNSDGSPMEGATGVTGAAPIWNSLMRIAHQVTPASFPVPDGLVAVEVCAVSGQMPEPACPKRRIDWFLEENIPVGYCSLHDLVAYDALSGSLATGTTPAERRVVKSVTSWPAEVLQWAIDEGLATPAQSTPQRATDDGGAGDAGGALRLTSPQDGGMYRVSGELPPNNQQMLVSAVCELCQHGERLSLVIDGEDWHSWTGPPYTTYWPLEAGDHVLSLEHQSISGSSWRSAPISISVVTAAPQGGNRP
jgi:penicillin-binding protein 1C